MEASSDSSTNLVKAVKRQLEFYFSNANLRRDKFMQTSMAASADCQSIPLQILFRFRKLTELTSSVEVVRSAIDKSKQLCFSEDNESVRRCEPFHIGSNSDFANNNQNVVDERTAYVARLPVNCTHESLKERLADYGTVSYISLPSFKSSKVIRGFAFVELKKHKYLSQLLENLRPQEEADRKKCAWEYFSRYTKKISALVKSAKQMGLANPFAVDQTYCHVPAEEGFSHLVALSKLDWIHYREEFRLWQVQQSQKLSQAIEACTDQYLKEEIRSEPSSQAEVACPAKVSPSPDKESTKGETQTRDETPIDTLEEGTILRVSSITPLQSLYRAHIRDAFSKFANDIAYLDVVDLRCEGYVRFKSVETAGAVLQYKTDNQDIFLAGYTLDALTCDELHEYGRKIELDRMKKKEAKKRKACKRQAQLQFKVASHKRPCALGPSSDSNPRRMSSMNSIQ